MQRQPHLVVLSKQFYHDELKPLLARWMILWLETFGVNLLDQDQLMSYLLNGPVDKKVVEIVDRKLGGEYVKMLNLSHDWLTSFAIHVLGKINRVGYGLLTAQDLIHQLQRDPKMPKSRKMMGVNHQSP